MPSYLDYAGQGVVAPGGHYRFGFATGATTILAGGTCLFALRWTDPKTWLVLLGLKAAANINTAFTTAQIVDIAVFFNRQWSTAPTVGTTLTPIKSFENMVRDNGTQPGFNQFQAFLPNIQIASTTAVTTGTRVQDSNPFARAQFSNSNALGNAAEAELVKTNYPLDYPIEFAQNEGLEIQVGTTQGAVGVVVYYFSMVLAVINAY